MIRKMISSMRNSWSALQISRYRKLINTSQWDIYKPAFDALAAMDNLVALTLVTDAVGEIGFMPEGKQLCAVEALANSPRPEACEFLLKKMRDIHHNYSSTHHCIIESLVKLGDPVAVSVIWEEKYLYHAGIEEESLFVVKAVAMIGGEAACKCLITALTSNKFESVRMVACKELARLKYKDAIASMVSLLIDEEAEVRKTAASALAELDEGKWQSVVIGDDRDFDRIGATHDQRIIGLLPQLLDRWFGDERRKKAISMAVSTGNHRLVEPLLKALGDGLPQVRVQAAAGLAALGEVKWQSVIHGDSGDFKRLGESNDERAVEPLLEALQRNADIDAAIALGILGNPKAIRPLHNYVMSCPGRLIKAAITAICSFGFEAAESTLSELILTKEREELWLPALEVLVSEGSRESCSSILYNSSLWPLSGYKDSTRLRKVLCHLNSLMSRQWTSDLLAEVMLRGDHYGAGCVMAEMLGEYGGERAKEALAKAVAEKMERVHVAAAHSLVKLGDPRGQKHLDGLSLEELFEHDPMTAASARKLDRKKVELKGLSNAIKRI